LKDTSMPVSVLDAPAGTDLLPRRGNRVSRAVARLLLSALRWHIVGALPNVPRMVLIGAPHTSNWDFIVGIATAWALNLRVTWLGKKELFRPPFEVVFHWLGGIPVDRGVSSGFVEQTVAVLGARERFALALSPEGTRKAVTRWKTGFYYIAMGTDAPIVLVTFDRPRRLIHLGPAITPTEDLDADLAGIRALYDSILAG